MTRSQEVEEGGEGEEGDDVGMGGGGRLYITLHCHHKKDYALRQKAI